MDIIINTLAVIASILFMLVLINTIIRYKNDDCELLEPMGWFCALMWTILYIFK